MSVDRSVRQVVANRAGLQDLRLPGLQTLPQQTGSPFNDLQLPTAIMLLAVLWRLRYELGFRDVAELLRAGMIPSHGNRRRFGGYSASAGDWRRW
ncbi:MAG: hypothetical protein O3B65_07155 [Chloroflexi bacterium]|nr:hypothetical protein [Chloroflexota bacterium]